VLVDGKARGSILHVVAVDRSSGQYEAGLKVPPWRIVIGSIPFVSAAHEIFRGIMMDLLLVLSTRNTRYDRKRTVSRYVLKAASTRPSSFHDLCSGRSPSPLSHPWPNARTCDRPTSGSPSDGIGDCTATREGLHISSEVRRTACEDGGDVVESVGLCQLSRCDNGRLVRQCRVIDAAWKDARLW
jgi:hypothetical protein